MSIRQSVNTGLLIGNNLQTAALRRQVAEMQQFIAVQQGQQLQVEDCRQIIFDVHKMLDSAERDLERDPISATHSAHMAHFSACYISEAALPDLGDKQALYQNQQRANDLLGRAEHLIPVETAQSIYRLALLQQIRSVLFQFHTWLLIAERLRGSAYLFIPPPGFFRGLILFLAGQLLGAIIAGYALMVFPFWGGFLFIACNGITLIFYDAMCRHTLLGKCNRLAQTAGGYVGPQMRTGLARQFVEQLRANLSSWGYKTRAKASREAGEELAKVDDEIAQIQRTYFPN